MDLSLFFAGTAGSVPTARRGLPAILLRRGADRVLFDCGEGTQRQLLRSSVGLVDLEEVFLTHLHADHYLGLPGMLKTFSLRMRVRPKTSS
jgi:ribonuclease Z